MNYHRTTHPPCTVESLDASGRIEVFRWMSSADHSPKPRNRDSPPPVSADQAGNTPPLPVQRNMEPENHKALQLLGIPDVTVRVPVLSNPAKKIHPWQFDCGARPKGRST